VDWIMSLDQMVLDVFGLLTIAGWGLACSR
jgi:hypothetical protein